VQEVTVAAVAAAAEIVVAAFSAAIEAPALVATVQADNNWAGSRTGRVSFAHSLDPPPAGGRVHSRVLSSGRSEEGTKGWASPGCWVLSLSWNPLCGLPTEGPSGRESTGLRRPRPEVGWEKLAGLLGLCFLGSKGRQRWAHTCCRAVPGGAPLACTPSHAFVG
jgi:hypothetical protein